MNGNVGKAETALRTRLDDWRFWVGVSYFGIAFCVMCLWWFNYTSDRADRQGYIANCQEIEAVKLEIREFIMAAGVDLGDAFAAQPCPRR